MRIDATNITAETTPKIEEMYPLRTNDQLAMIAAQFHQEPNWEHGNMPMSLSELEETTPLEPGSEEIEDESRPGIIKSGHLFHTEDMHAYRINTEGVHPLSEHHIFVTRHGLYFYAEDDPSSHLLRYGKYQARMAGHKINKAIRELIRKSGPVTRPIKLISSTQTRAFETLYNIRLQLDNDLDFESEIIQDTGLTECTDAKRQRYRWLYFVREYLQPIKSKKREHTITIIASHGNLLTTFDHIIQNFVNRHKHLETFPALELPQGTGILHAQTMLYRSTGAKPVNLIQMIVQDEIPITINHAQMKRDFYYEWAAVHKCRSSHGREEMQNYIRSTILDNVFATGHFENRIVDYAAIVYMEMEHEYDTHLLPMMMRTCRTYLYRLPFTQANTDFESFNRLMSPVPIPDTVEEQKTPLQTSFHRFNAYGMPFPVVNTIQKFRKHPTISREQIPPGTVHPNSRDEKNSHLTRLGINQIRGATTVIIESLKTYMLSIPAGIRKYPITIAAEPTIEAAESCFHVRHILQSAKHQVAEQVTDLGIQFNYFQKKSLDDFKAYQRVQILYMLRHYFSPDKNDSIQPSLQVHILCGDGRLFTAFRQEMVMNGLIKPPIPKFLPHLEAGYNAMKHANTFLFETIEVDQIKLFDVLTIAESRAIRDDQKIATQHPIRMTTRELRYWHQSSSGPCTLSYLIDHRETLALAVVGSSAIYQRQVARLLLEEWNPYLAGLFIYTCRLQLALSLASQTCRQRQVMNETVNQCVESVGDSA